MNLTRKAAVYLFRKQWEWLAETGNTDKREFIESIQGHKNICANCYLCEYVTRDKEYNKDLDIASCKKYCPIEWPDLGIDISNSVPCVKSYYTLWQRAKDFSARSRVARIISSLPEKKENESFSPGDIIRILHDDGLGSIKQAGKGDIGTIIRIRHLSDGGELVYVNTFRNDQYPWIGRPCQIELVKHLKKSDLKTGLFVELRNNTTFLVLRGSVYGDQLVSNTISASIPFEAYYDNLKHISNDRWDIVSLYAPDSLALSIKKTGLETILWSELNI